MKRLVILVVLSLIVLGSISGLDFLDYQAEIKTEYSASYFDYEENSLSLSLSFHIILFKFLYMGGEATTYMADIDSLDIRSYYEHNFLQDFNLQMFIKVGVLTFGGEGSISNPVLTNTKPNISTGWNYSVFLSIKTSSLK